MTANSHLCLLAIGLVMVGWCSRVLADDDEVTIYGVTPSSSSAKSSSSAGSAKSGSTDASATSTASTTHHRKKKTSTAANSSTSSTTGTTATASTSTHSSHKHKSSSAAAADAPSVVSAPIIVVSSSNSTGNSTTSAESGAPMTIPIPPANLTHPTGAGPAVETGLPVAKPGSAPVYGSSNFSHYQMASAFPMSSPDPVGSYLAPTHVKKTGDTFSFTNFEQKRHNVYPWKYNIITTEFWIGEGGSVISSTDNVASAWDANWREDNHGTDSPNDRDGFAPAGHAAMINPFYVALPFNDLAFPEKARRWLPAGWYRPPKDGKPVSACKDRWVEIKNEQGDTCFAQWEDVGPLRYDHAEYVFGPERPDTYTRAGLDVSPAVADYLNINGKNRITRWRFVDDADVQPGAWLQYDEQALLLNAIKNTPTQPLPIRSARAPIEDGSDIDSNQKMINKAKG
jgi:hypothetical protein